MRRSIAILLALVFSWMLITPAFAGSDESNLPVCCRAHGKHHCKMRMGRVGQRASFSAISERCPCFPHSMPATHVETFVRGISHAVFAGLVRQPTISAQTEASYRASYLRSKQKRGPPPFTRS